MIQPEGGNGRELVRAVSRASLTAIALNGMIGAGIFALPASVTLVAGAGAPLAYVIAGLAILLIALCFAEAGSMFEVSGGPYVYSRAAFGRFVGFEVGWLFVLARLTAVAAISNTFSDYLGYLWAPLAHGLGRVGCIVVQLTALAAVNARGVRLSAMVINALTVAKIVPLVLFCAAGMPSMDLSLFSFSTIPESTALRQASLMLIFAFGGFEFASVPSEEVVEPRRSIPFALIVAVGSVVVLYLSIQVVAMATLPTLATSVTPLAAAATGFMGPVGGLIVTIGAVFSTTGTNSASILVGPRMLYALAKGGDIPESMARVHPRFRTPVVSIVIFSVIALALAVSGTFSQLAAVSALARLLFYSTTCLAVLVLRRTMPASERRFTLPGGPMLPVLGMAVCFWLLSGSSRQHLGLTAVAILAGIVLYSIGRMGSFGAKL